MNYSAPFTILTFAVLVTVGCSDQEEPTVNSDMHEDLEHDHRHQHTDADGHEHEHEDGFRGTHSHGHSHSHRHGDPIHGGRIVSIGHTHHKGGATHYHAEVMPVENTTVRFYVLTESDDGESKDFPIADREITALISVKGEEAAATDVEFTSSADGESAEFGLKIPDDLSAADSFTVVVPMIKLGGQRLNFSFTASRAADEKAGHE